MEEFHLTIFVPSGLASPVYDAIRQTLVSPLFRTRLRRAVQNAFGRHPELTPVKVKLSR